MLDDYLMPTYGDPPVTFISGDGVELTDSSGKKYLDFIAGISVVNVGHSNKKIANCIKKQSKKLMHTSNLFGNEHGPALARDLDELIALSFEGAESAQKSAQVGQVFFCNSGAEANEAAIKLARKFGGYQKYGIISAHSSFHGRTLAALAATGQPSKQEPFAPMLEGFKFVEYGDAAALADTIDQNTVAVLLEPIQGEGGIVSPPVHYLKEVRKICDERGVLMILDEVQTALGRTGNWFAFHPDEILPDVVTMAKALGNGFPIGACWAKKEVAEVFELGDHASTFGGQALATSVARTVIEILKEIDAPNRAKYLGEKLAAGLLSIKGVKEVRGRGLMLAAELDLNPDINNVTSKVIVEECLNEGLVLSVVTPTALRFTPPLIIDEKHIEQAVEILDSVMRKLIR